MTEEGKFQAAIIELATVCGWLAYHTHDSRRSTPGFPDLVLVRGGVLLFRELKTDTGKTSKAQLALDARDSRSRWRMLTFGDRAIGLKSKPR